MVSLLLGLIGAGAAGTLARFGVQELARRWDAVGFPWGTLAVNAFGCLLYGALWALAEERGVLSPPARAACLTGFLGAFTTFSAFAFETTRLLHSGQAVLAVGNLLAQNGVGLAAVALGMKLGRLG